MGLRNTGPVTPEYAETLRKIIRTPQDAADFLIAEFEAQTGTAATDEDRADALAYVRERAESGEPRTPDHEA